MAQSQPLGPHQQQRPVQDDADAVYEEDESVYVVIDMQAVDKLPEPGSSLQLQGMDTGAPRLHLPDGTELVGTFEETVGTQLVMGDELQADGTHHVQLVCHTDKRIVFTKPPEQQQQQEDAGEPLTILQQQQQQQVSM